MALFILYSMYNRNPNTIYLEIFYFNVNFTDMPHSIIHDTVLFSKKIKSQHNFKTQKFSTTYKFPNLQYIINEELTYVTEY